jgi:uracil-DNA glycosylase family 4
LIDRALAAVAGRAILTRMTAPFDPAPPELLACRRCPRLVEHREQVARVKRRAYRDEDYWGRPVPGFGDPEGPILILGLAPGAHGANRTGRVFTGDASGDFLFAALHRAGFASQPESTGRDDGLALRDLYITAAARCVPPGNRPTREEVARCRIWLDRDLRLPRLRVVLALGRIAHDAYLDWLLAQGEALVKTRLSFAHGAEHRLPERPLLLDSYHVSFQNTNTGRLTAAMFDAVLARARRLAGLRGPGRVRSSGRGRSSA